MAAAKGKHEGQVEGIEDVAARSQRGTAGADAGNAQGASSAQSDASTGNGGTWASGGTAAITGNYSDPFSSTATACALLVAATEGPCTEAADQVRKDISEGLTGLPVRLALKVVDSSCKAISGAKVKVWHTQISGSYSGNTPNPGMCLKSSSEASKHYFRGVQTSDAAGRVDFDTCFPGWYRGRTIHIHFTVSKGGKSFTSQLLFDQALITEIFSSHPEYKPYGQPDTSNASDNVVRGNELAKFILTTARMSDGVMLASKELVVSL